MTILCCFCCFAMVPYILWKIQAYGCKLRARCYSCGMFNPDWGSPFPSLSCYSDIHVWYSSPVFIPFEIILKYLCLSAFKEVIFCQSSGSLTIFSKGRSLAIFSKRDSHYLFRAKPWSIEQLFFVVFSVFAIITITLLIVVTFTHFIKLLSSLFIICWL